MPVQSVEWLSDSAHDDISRLLEIGWMIGSNLPDGKLLNAVAQKDLVLDSFVAVCDFLKGKSCWWDKPPLA